MKRVIKCSKINGSWLGSSSNRRRIDDMIDKGCTWEDITDYLNELEDNGMLPEDANMLRTWAKEEYRQSVEMKFN